MAHLSIQLKPPATEHDSITLYFKMASILMTFILLKPILLEKKLP